MSYVIDCHIEITKVFRITKCSNLYVSYVVSNWWTACYLWLRGYFLDETRMPSFSNLKRLPRSMSPACYISYRALSAKVLWCIVFNRLRARYNVCKLFKPMKVFSSIGYMKLWGKFNCFKLFIFSNWLFGISPSSFLGRSKLSKRVRFLNATQEVLPFNALL